MNDTTPSAALPPCLDRLPPTQDELPYDDGRPMESHRHVLQMVLLMQTLLHLWEGRDDVFVGANMFVYFSPDQVRTHDFRGPDVFVALGVPKRERKSWVVWEEGGKGPDLVIELLSETTAAVDKGEKMRIYQERLRVPEYFWYDPFTTELAGFALVDGEYQPIQPDAAGNLTSRLLSLVLMRWQGVYSNDQATWLRWATPDGTLIPTPAEAADAARQRAEEERLRAEGERLRAETLEARLDRYQQQFGELPE